MATQISKLALFQALKHQHAALDVLMSELVSNSQDPHSLQQHVGPTIDQARNAIEALEAELGITSGGNKQPTWNEFSRWLGTDDSRSDGAEVGKAAPGGQTKPDEPAAEVRRERLDEALPLPEDLRNWLIDQARANGRSLDAEMAVRLQRSRLSQIKAGSPDSSGDSLSSDEV